MIRYRLTEHTTKLIAKGDLSQAEADHEATVDAAFERAEKGELICLTDLICSNEKIIAAEAEQRIAGQR